MFKHTWIILLLAIALLPAGCARYNGQPGDVAVPTTTLTFSESDVQTQITSITNTNEQLPISNTAVDLQAGQIVITGDIQAGRQSAPVTITMELGTQDGQITASVTNAELNGAPLSNDVISQFNEAFAARLAERVNADNRNVVSVTITDNDIQITVEADDS